MAEPVRNIEIGCGNFTACRLWQILIKLEEGSLGPAETDLVEASACEAMPQYLRRPLCERSG